MCKKWGWMVGIIMILLSLISYWLLDYFGYISHKIYTAHDFGITTLKSKRDYNQNGIDDYTDLLNGARKDAQNKPRYHSAYYAGGYPPDDEGVCTDTIWRAFKEAGYILRDMVDEDIRRYPERYPHITTRDANIDFRRVINLKIYFENHLQKLTTDRSDLAAWQPGDIVILGKDDNHIGIISDKRNRKGIPYLIHNAGQPHREEDVLSRYVIQGHYRLYDN